MELVKPIISVEGMDRCSKSTFIKMLRKKVSNPKIMTIHSDAPPQMLTKKEDILDWSLSHYINAIDMQLLLVNTVNANFILDRSYVGDAVYGYLYRDMYKDEASMDWMFKQTKEIARYTQYFMFIDSGKNIMNRDDGLSLASDEESFDKEYHRWLYVYSLMKNNGMNVHLIDWSKIEYSDQIVSNIVNLALKQ